MLQVSQVWVKETSPDISTGCIHVAEYDPYTGLFYFGDGKCIHVSNVRSWTQARPAQATPTAPKKLTEAEQATVSAVRSKLKTKT